MKSGTGVGSSKNRAQISGKKVKPNVCAKMTGINLAIRLRAKEKCWSNTIILGEVATLSLGFDMDGGPTYFRQHIG